MEKTWGEMRTNEMSESIAKEMREAMEATVGKVKNMRRRRRGKRHDCDAGSMETDSRRGKRGS